MAHGTRQLIIEAIIKLVKEKPIAKITVNNILEECNISRSTFYYYFNDIYDGLAFIFKQRGRKVVYEHPGQDSWYVLFYTLCMELKKNQEFVYCVYQQVRREQIEDFLFQMIKELVNATVDNLKITQQAYEDEIETVVKFYSYAFCGFVIDWVRTGMIKSPEDLTYDVISLVDGNIEKTLKMQREFKIWAKPQILPKI